MKSSVFERGLEVWIEFQRSGEGPVYSGRRGKRVRAKAWKLFINIKVPGDFSYRLGLGRVWDRGLEIRVDGKVSCNLRDKWGTTGCYFLPH